MSIERLFSYELSIQDKAIIVLDKNWSINIQEGTKISKRTLIPL